MSGVLIPNLDTGSTPVSSINNKTRPVRVLLYLNKIDAASLPQAEDGQADLGCDSAKDHCLP
jgi:hypothetical protein